MNRRITGILIAAGFSQRMGKLKALLPYHESTFAGHIIQKMAAVCNEVLVVLGYKADEIKNNISVETCDRNIRFVLNPEYELGMTTSLQAGIRAAGNADWILYHFVDQPGLPLKFYQQFLTQVDDRYDWIQPQNESRNGHPVLLQRTLFNDILKLNIEQSLRDISYREGTRKKYWLTAFPQIFQDIDRLQDYKDISK